MSFLGVIGREDFVTYLDAKKVSGLS